MRVDTYKPQINSSGLWLKTDGELARQCEALAFGDVLSTRELYTRCFDQDLPLYEGEPAHLGWHLFALLGHFEWVSSAFAFFYIEGPWNHHSWWISTAMVSAGTIFFLPWRGTAFVNETLLLLVNMGACAAIFYNYRNVRNTSPEDSQSQESESDQGSANSAAVPKSRLMVVKVPRALLKTETPGFEATSLKEVHLPAMRFAEYCISASELWVAVLAVFVTDPPAFMSVGGYSMILLCNLTGILLHYSMASDVATRTLASQMSMLKRIGSRSARRNRTLSMHVPKEWLSKSLPADTQENDKNASGKGDSKADNTNEYNTAVIVQQSIWKNIIASSMSTLLISWLVYITATSLIFYQQTLLFSPDPPAFVVFSGWSLLVFYSSFGFWVTVVYFFPHCVVNTMCSCTGLNTYRLTTLGLDILSVSAKLSIVGALSFGFVFREEGRCN